MGTRIVKSAVIECECDRCGARERVGLGNPGVGDTPQSLLTDLAHGWARVTGCWHELELTLCRSCFADARAFVSSRVTREQLAAAATRTQDLHPQLASARRWAARWKALAKRTGDAATNKRVRDVLAHQHSFLAEHADSMADVDEAGPALRADVCVCGHLRVLHELGGPTALFGSGCPCTCALDDGSRCGCTSFRGEVLRSDQGLAPVDMPAERSWTLCVCGHGPHEHFNVGGTVSNPCHAWTPDVRLPSPSIDFTHCGCCKFELARRVKR